MRMQTGTHLDLILPHPNLGVLIFRYLTLLSLCVVKFTKRIILASIYFSVYLIKLSSQTFFLYRAQAGQA